MFLGVACFALAAMPVKGSCLHFEGDGQVAVVPYQKELDLPQATIELWIKAEPNDRYYNYLLCRNYANFGWGLALHGRPDKVFSQATEAKVPIGEWTHLALVYSDKAEKVYVNGELAAARERGSSHQPFVHDLWIGNSDMFGSPGDEPTPFHGSIDELRIWNKPHTQAEVRATMKRYLRGNEPHLVGYFTFDEGQGQIIHDFSGHLISGCLGHSFQADEADPAWAQGVALAGRKPHARER